VEVIPDKKSPNAPRTDIEIGRDFCNKLFEIERTLASLSSDKRKRRTLSEKPVLESFCCGINSLTLLKIHTLGRCESMHRTRNHIWRIISWKEDASFLIMLLRTASDHTRSEERTGFL